MTELLGDPKESGTNARFNLEQHCSVEIQCESHRFSSSHIKNQNQIDAVNFNNAFYLT